MISIGVGHPSFLATGVTDLRCAMNRLYALILDQLRQEPLSGALFCFANRRRDTVKLFCFDEGGVRVAAKLSQGRGPRERVRCLVTAVLSDAGWFAVPLPRWRRDHLAHEEPLVGFRSRPVHPESDRHRWRRGPL